MNIVVIAIARRDRVLTIGAGPYRRRPDNTFGVCLAAEYPDDEKDHWLPTPDFTAAPARDFEDTLAVICKAASEGRLPYLGCIGGIGRTGTVIAGLVRVLTGMDAASAKDWTRAHYHHHAIERDEQFELVKAFDADRVRRLIQRDAPLLVPDFGIQPFNPTWQDRLIAFIKRL